VSATDIARELSPFAQKIYQSQRNGAFDLPASMLPENAVRIGEVSAFNQPVPAEENASNELLLLGEEESIPATITLKTGQKICGIDHVILCTGYHISLPYLPTLTSASTAPEHASDTVLVTDGTQYHNLHKDIFYIPDPSLLFIGVPYFTATFTLFEFQAMVVAKVLSGAVTLPSEAEMRREYEERVREKGYGKAFHSLREREVQYVDELLAWVNANLQRQGTGPVRGHTEGWKRAKEEQWARVRLLLGQAGGVEVIQEIESVC
jgi:ACS family pantothenate transporter-like MFS transporter